MSVNANMVSMLPAPRAGAPSPGGSSASTINSNSTAVTDLEMSRPTSLQFSMSTPSETSTSRSKSPKITVVPKKGSFELRESFRRIKVEPTEKELHHPIHKGPASRHTVVTVAGLLCVSMLLMTSGGIVLCTENNSEYEMRCTGWAFIGIGLFMLVVCGLLQRKNWARYMNEVDSDLYFLHLGHNPVWNLMKLDILDFASLSYSLKNHGSSNRGSSLSPVPENTQSVQWSTSRESMQRAMEK